MIHRPNFAYCSILILAIIISGCGSSDSNNANPSSPINDRIKNAVGLEQKNPSDMDVLGYHDFKADCQSLSQSGQTIHFTSTFTLTPMGMTRTGQGPEQMTFKTYRATMQIYADAACELLLYETIEEGSYDSKRARSQFQLNAKKSTISPNRTEVVTDFNQQKFCSLGDWKLNHARSVLGTECASTSQNTITIHSRDADDRSVELISCQDESKPTDDTCVIFKYSRVEAPQ
jgi:hypothetical protein